MRALAFRLVLLLSLMAPSMAPAGSMQDWLPATSLTPEQSAVQLSAEALGPPARSYDHTSRSLGAASADARAVEALALGKRADALAAPDSLRRYGELSLQARQSGELHAIHEWFLAEHVGLAMLPHVLGWFVCGEDVAAASAQVKEMVGDLLDDDELQAVAVTLHPLPEKHAWLGQVSALVGAADFEPFPRVFSTGDMARVPGTSLSRRQKYSLFVGRRDTPEVQEYPLAGEGRFDVEFPLPETPGVVRVAMSRAGRRSPPETTFFFTLYVGEEPPSAFGALNLDLQARSGPVEPEEALFASTVNETRSAFGLKPLSRAGEPASMRAKIAAAPSGERAFHRYFHQIAGEDPATELAHGGWTSFWCDGTGGADSAWMCLESPAVRSLLLDPERDLLALGAHRETGTSNLHLFGSMMSAPEGGDQVREQAYAALRGGGAAHTLKQAQAALDAVAAQVASGDLSQKQAMKAVEAMVKKGTLVTGRSMYGLSILPIGMAPDLNGYTAADGLNSAAVGTASGALGQKGGVSYVVLVILTAEGGS